MYRMTKQAACKQAMVKLAQVRLAINYVLRSRAMEKAAANAPASANTPDAINALRTKQTGYPGGIPQQPAPAPASANTPDAINALRTRQTGYPGGMPQQPAPAPQPASGSNSRGFGTPSQRTPYTTWNQVPAAIRDTFRSNGAFQQNFNKQNKTFNYTGNTHQQWEALRNQRNAFRDAYKGLSAEDQQALRGLYNRNMSLFNNQERRLVPMRSVKELRNSVVSPMQKGVWNRKTNTYDFGGDMSAYQRELDRINNAWGDMNQYEKAKYQASYDRHIDALNRWKAFQEQQVNTPVRQSTPAPQLASNGNNRGIGIQQPTPAQQSGFQPTPDDWANYAALQQRANTAGMNGNPAWGDEDQRALDYYKERFSSVR